MEPRVTHSPTPAASLTAEASIDPPSPAMPLVSGATGAGEPSTAATCAAVLRHYLRDRARLSFVRGRTYQPRAVDSYRHAVRQARLTTKPACPPTPGHNATREERAVWLDAIEAFGRWEEANLDLLSLGERRAVEDRIRWRERGVDGAAQFRAAWEAA
jgi:hypothetical protein